MSSIKNFQNAFENRPSIIRRSMMVVFLLASTHISLTAQATLSAQGILKKSNGTALEDGTYTMTFKIYAVDGSPSGVLWDETISDVELNGGIYSVTLGANMADPLTVPFDQDYEMGVSVGTSEMLPRIRLTSAPYALSLRGQSNQFPSTGLVLADEIKVAQGVLASGGAPGLNGVDKNGYAFSGNNGDNDSGLFSTSDAKVSLFVNNAEVLAVTPGTATVTGTLNSNNVDIINNGSLKYNGISDWRLAYVDNINSTSADGWQVYNPIAGGGQAFGWNNPNAAGPAPRVPYNEFVGTVLEPANYGQVLKKLYTIAGTYSEIKVKFRYYAMNQWWTGDGNAGFAGFATSADAMVFRIGWISDFSIATAYAGLNNTAFGNATKIKSTNVSDQWKDIEMTAMANGTDFWLIIGATLNQAPPFEFFAISRVEVYVR
jgi:hypothetical protein